MTLQGHSLPTPIEARLERYAARLERQPLDELIVLAARPLDPVAHDQALRTAERLATEQGRAGAVDSAIEAMGQFVDRQFSDSARPWVAPMSSPGTIADRARLVDSLRVAVTALITWDVLDSGSRDELLGPWVGFVA